MAALVAAPLTPGKALLQQLRQTPDAGMAAAVSVLRRGIAKTSLKGLGEVPPRPERMDFGEEAVARINGTINLVLSAVVGFLCTIGAEALTAVIVAASSGSLAPFSFLIQAALGGLCVGIAGELIATLIRNYFTRLFPDFKVKELVKAIWESAYQTEMPGDLLDRVFARIDGEDIVSVAGIYLVAINPDYDLGYQQRLREWQEALYDETARRLATDIDFYPTGSFSILPLIQIEKGINAIPTSEIRDTDRASLKQRVRDKIVASVIDRDAHEAARKANELAVRRAITKLQPASQRRVEESQTAKTIVFGGLFFGALFMLIRRGAKA